MDIEKLYDKTPVALNLKYLNNISAIKIRTGTIIVRKYFSPKTNSTSNKYFLVYDRSRYGEHKIGLFNLSTGDFGPFEENPPFMVYETIAEITPYIVIDYEAMVNIKKRCSFNTIPIGVIFYHKDTETICIKTSKDDCIRSCGDIWSPIPYDEVYPLIDIIDYIP